MTTAEAIAIAYQRPSLMSDRLQAIMLRDMATRAAVENQRAQGRWGNLYNLGQNVTGTAPGNATRGLILAALTRPMTTHDLSRVTGLTYDCVSNAADRLARAGQITREKASRVTIWGPK